jgi:CubicO group peptidase (beta-lactamase class C family)
VPSRNGKEITLRDLATQRSGLPRLPEMDPADPANPYADLDTTRLFAFLAGCALSRDPGAGHEYSNLGVGLLGAALAWRAGTSYEQLVLERLTGPLELDDTRVTLSPEQTARFARGHADGKPVANWTFDALAGAGALRSTARDLLDFAGTNAGLRYTPLADAMARLREHRVPTDAPGLETALGWQVRTGNGRTLFWHNGGTGGYRSFCGFDPERQVGVVVLTNGTHEIDDLGFHALDPEIPLSRTPAK